MESYVAGRPNPSKVKVVDAHSRVTLLLRQLFVRFNDLSNLLEVGPNLGLGAGFTYPLPGRFGILLNLLQRLPVDPFTP
jgi:hypothetical protein